MEFETVDFELEKQKKAIVLASLTNIVYPNFDCNSLRLNDNKCSWVDEIKLPTVNLTSVLIDFTYIHMLVHSPQSRH